MYAQLHQVASLLTAQTGDGGAGPASCARDGFLLPVIMLAILYFVWMRPEQRQRKKREEMLSALKRGDEVVTSSGILGSIADMSDKIVTLEVARNVKIRVLRSTVHQRVKDLEATEDDVKKDDAKAKSSKS